MAKKDKGKSREGSKKVRVRTAKGRSSSSTRWLSRQLNDPFVAKAKKEGYRSRAAYKLTEIDDKYKIIRPGMKIIDLGAAPGSWSQVAIKRMKGRGVLVGIDLQEMEPLTGAVFIKGDFLDEAAFQEIQEKCEGGVDVVLSDMAAPACGHTQTDHIRIIALLEAAVDFAVNNLKPGGSFVGKILRGGLENELLGKMKKHFESVRHFKPASSRQDSAEMYVVATGFRN